MVLFQRLFVQLIYNSVYNAICTLNFELHLTKLWFLHQTFLCNIVPNYNYRWRIFEGLWSLRYTVPFSQWEETTSILPNGIQLPLLSLADEYSTRVEYLVFSFCREQQKRILRILGFWLNSTDKKWYGSRDEYEFSAQVFQFSHKNLGQK